MARMEWKRKNVSPNHCAMTTTTTKITSVSFLFLFMSTENWLFNRFVLRHYMMNYHAQKIFRVQHQWESCCEKTKQNKTIGCKNSRECKREKRNTSVKRKKYTYKIRSQRTIFSSTTHILKISNRQHKSSCSQSLSLSHRFILIFYLRFFSLAHLFFVYNMRFFLPPPSFSLIQWQNKRIHN